MIAEKVTEPRGRRRRSDLFQLPPAWWPLGLSSAISTGPSPRWLGAQCLAVYRDRTGAVRAVEDRCPHRRLPLSMGQLTPEGYVQCAYHGWAFDGVSGACVAIPNFADDEPPPAAHRVATFPVVEVDGLVFVWTGDPIRPAAPPALLESGRVRCFTLQVRSPYERIAEAILWNPGDVLGLPSLFGSADELVTPRIDVESGAITARRERVSFAFPRISTYRPIVEHSVGATITMSIATGFTDVCAAGPNGRSSARAQVALTPVGSYRTGVCVRLSLPRGLANTVRFAAHAARRPESLAATMERAADAVEDIVADPALVRFREVRFNSEITR